MLMRVALPLVLCLAVFLGPQPQTPTSDTVFLLRPAHVFDGDSAQLHDGWAILIRGEKIEAAGPAAEIKTPPDAKVVDLPQLTLLPGLIEAHSHVLLHPYSETP